MRAARSEYGAEHGRDQRKDGWGMFGAGQRDGTTERRQRRQRRFAVAAVGAVLVATCTAACGADGAIGDRPGGAKSAASGEGVDSRRDGADGKGGPRVTLTWPATTTILSAAGPAPTPLTDAQLTAGSFTDGERIGAYTASAYALGAPLGENYTAEPTGCQPLVSLARGATLHAPVAEVNRGFEDADETYGVTVAVQLRSYAARGAAGVLGALRAAGRQCADGFTEDRGLARARYLSVESADAPDLGDEAVAYRFTILDVRDVRGEAKLYEYLTVVRDGACTLSFRAETTDGEDIGGVPEEIVRAQWEKFRAAAG
ncbi:hypothetical protein ACIOHE_17700 [Streptomyces sp. NPDC087851]|uniref:hypothetical protein n=1 Tax=Streptomyces sp. NPDC087851 TaxID=3365810 RepID=UPI0037FDE7C2